MVKRLVHTSILAGLVVTLSACNFAGKPNLSDDQAAATSQAGTASVSSAVGQATSQAEDSANAYAMNSNGALSHSDQSQNMAGDQGYPQMVQNSTRAPENQTYYFSFDSSRILRPGDMAAIKAQADYLAAHPKATVRLEGNTDDRGSREYNIALGWRRDQAIEQILMQHGVAKHQIKMVSYGKERPAVFGENESAWSLNRRVNLVYEATS